MVKAKREVIYLGMHNDVSFLIGDEMDLYEQQLQSKSASQDASVFR